MLLCFCYAVVVHFLFWDRYLRIVSSCIIYRVFYYGIVYHHFYLLNSWNYNSFQTNYYNSINLLHPNNYYWHSYMYSYLYEHAFATFKGYFYLDLHMSYSFCMELCFLQMQIWGTFSRFCTFICLIYVRCRLFVLVRRICLVALGWGNLRSLQRRQN